MNKAIRKYDIAEYAAKGGDAIDRMMATQQAGKLVKGSKHDVCVAMREKLKVALEAGFTVQQIAEALKDGDVFGILPKTILEIVKGDKKPVVRRKAKGTTETKKTTSEPVSTPKTLPDSTTKQVTRIVDAT
ncbi:hypothetical protein [Polaromonas naphthalenivorans]|uniref:Uncharacterized protein n=1 Tax=Polaromonas naphthalenivorans (strain CJ2) TaxID=365044 RepID=A1VX54_POLNA|nr:hypothetical protein [Polaromonas naphthalenivorans]ABM40232.1 hypothetical protein Pnap_4984 [Polaromonas naphthalenivorans CJ2]